MGGAGCFARRASRGKHGVREVVDDVLSLRKLLQGMLAASMDLSTARYGYVAVVDEELQPVAEVAAGDDRLLPVMQGLAEWAIRAECAVAIRDTGDSGLCRAVAAGLRDAAVNPFRCAQRRLRAFRWPLEARPSGRRKPLNRTWASRRKVVELSVR